jgi:hypothetical protein
MAGPLFHFAPNGLVSMFSSFGIADAHEGYIPMLGDEYVSL